jgi:transposase-like protein
MTARRKCSVCQGTDLDKGRAADGRRAYRCQRCGATWTDGLQGRKPRYSHQRQGDQFANTGASRNKVTP